MELFRRPTCETAGTYTIYLRWQVNLLTATNTIGNLHVGLKYAGSR